MAGVFRILSRGCLLRQAFPTVTRRSNMATQKATAYNEMEAFWAKNKQLARPLSPTLTIYGYHLTMVMSISNRVSAVALQGILIGGSIVMLAVPVKFQSIVEKIRGWNLNPAVIYTGKCILALPFVYHFIASVRHLVWDTGVGYKGPTVIKGGYAILVATAIVTAGLVFGVKPSAL